MYCIVQYIETHINPQNQFGIDLINKIPEYNELETIKLIDN